MENKDNGLFNLCLLKYNNFYRVYPDEINLYDLDGNQLHHTNIDFNTNIDFYLRFSS